MSKKDLKQQNKDLEINVIDILSSLDPSETNKFTPFLIKMLRKEMDRPKLRKLRATGKIANNIIEEHMISFILDFMGRENFDTVKSFHEHLTNNRIPEDKRDINQYDTWYDLVKSVNIADLKAKQKSLEKQVIKVLETEEWLAIRPLTLESSLIYGSGAKWCTAMKNNPDYFYRYSRNGVLTYVINKKDGDKYGVYLDHNSKEFSIWDAPDRRIDSVETNIPSDMIKQIYQMSRYEERNYSYFSQEEKMRDGSEMKKSLFTIEEVAQPDLRDEEAPILEQVEMLEADMYDDVELVTEEGEVMNVVWRGAMEGEDRVYETINETECDEEIGYDEPRVERDPWVLPTNEERGRLR